MMTNILSDFGVAMAGSKIISIIGILVQFLLIVIEYFLFKERLSKLKIGIVAVTVFLVLLNIFFIWNGRLSERVIDEFGGKVYFGQVENGKANGWGRLFDEERNIEYIGYFHNNKYDGEGSLYHYEKKGDNRVKTSKYDGGFEDGERSGYGKYYLYRDGEEFLAYDGEFRYDKYNGKGKYIYYDEKYKKIGYYDGCWAYDERFGFGVVEWRSAESNDMLKYIGTFVSNKYEGWGNFYREDKIVYSGYWSDDLYQGKGTLYYTDSDGERLKYEGEFSKGMRSGHGKVYDKNGDLLLDGEFEEDKFVSE